MSGWEDLLAGRRKLGIAYLYEKSTKLMIEMFIHSSAQIYFIENLFKGGRVGQE